MNKLRHHHKFSSKWGFILTAVGSAVGMANVWGFPYKLTSNGGGAFLLIYLVFIAIFAYCGLSAEYAIGRLSGTGTVGSYQRAWQDRGLGKVGRILGFLPLLGSLCIAIGYAVIIAYVLKSLAETLTGSLLKVDAASWFESFSMHNFSVLPYQFIVIALTLLTCITGAKSIEKANKVMMPLFFILFIVLAIRVAFLDNAWAGYQFVFHPDFSLLKDPNVIVGAMGQAFFSLSITGSGMIVCGAYMRKQENIVGSAKQTALFDTIAALVAALVLVPAVFSFGAEQSGGPSLLFVTLPEILKTMPGGYLFGVVLYLVVLFGGVSSLQNMFEAVCESLLHICPKLSRPITLALLGGVTFGIGAFMNPIAQTKGAILGGWGSWMDLVSIYIIPLGATLGAISWFWLLKKETLLAEINHGTTKVYGKVWYYLGKFLYAPLALILCYVALRYQVAF